MNLCKVVDFFLDDGAINFDLVNFLRRSAVVITIACFFVKD